MRIFYALQFIAFGITVFLLCLNVSNFDIAASKNNALAYERKQEIDMMTNIDSVKAMAKKEIDWQRNERRSISKEANTQFMFLLGLLVVQISVWIINRKLNSYKARLYSK